MVGYVIVILELIESAEQVTVFPPKVAPTLPNFKFGLNYNINFVPDYYNVSYYKDNVYVVNSPFKLDPLSPDVI